MLTVSDLFTVRSAVQHIDDWADQASWYVTYNLGPFSPFMSIHFLLLNHHTAHVCMMLPHRLQHLLTTLTFLDSFNIPWQFQHPLPIFIFFNMFSSPFEWHTCLHCCSINVARNIFGNLFWELVKKSLLHGIDGGRDQPHLMNHSEITVVFEGKADVSFITRNDTETKNGDGKLVLWICPQFVRYVDCTLIVFSAGVWCQLMCLGVTSNLWLLNI